jgi:hypothetical protein
MVEMKKKLIIHIGTPKTGSSFLQEVCVKNYEKLLAAGVLYPGIDDGEFIKKANVPINASNILSVFTNDISKQKTCALLKQHLESVFSFGVDKVLLSDETLNAFNVQDKGNLYIFECLVDVCTASNIDVSFIAYYRKPSKYLPSHWAQLVKKHNETLSLIDFVEQNKIPYWGNLVTLSSQYNNVSILSYDKEARESEGIAKSFFNVVGVDCSNFDILTNQAINPSLSLNTLTALRLINAEFNEDVIRNIEVILTGAQPKHNLSKPRLSNEKELFVNKLYETELCALNTLSDNDLNIKTK